MNQLSGLPFGTDASTLVAYATRASDRLGNFSLVIENVGNTTLSMQVRTLGGTGGTVWSPIESFFTVVAGGNTTRNYSIVNKVIGFFGSGGTQANVSAVLRNKADLRGAQLDLYVLGKKGWGFDPGFNVPAFMSPPFGSPPDSPSTTALE